MALAVRLRSFAPTVAVYGVGRMYAILSEGANPAIEVFQTIEAADIWLASRV